MFERLQQIAVFGILLALLWIGYELHALRVGSLTVGGAIDANVYSGSALKVEISR